MYPIIQIFGISIPTYFVWLSFTYCACLVGVVMRAKKLGYRKNEALDLAMVAIFGGFVGARLFHVALEAPGFYWSQPFHVFYFWEGGYVFYGGLAGAFFFAYKLVEYRRQNPYLWMDFATPILSGGYAVGRLACFFTGCCFGKACDLPWAMTVPSLRDGIARHPAQLYAVFLEVLVFCVILLAERRRGRDRSSRSFFHYVMGEQGSLFFLWLILHGTTRIFIEQFRDDFRGGDMLGMSVSTWISFVVVTLGVLGFVKTSRRLIQSV